MRKASKIKFSKRVYAIGNIQSAIEAYKDLARFKVSDEGRYIDVLLNLNDPGTESGNLMDEFKNYVLFLECA